MAFYRGDVAGAFDKIDADILLGKCRLAGLHPKFLKVLVSWLRGRVASVVNGVFFFFATEGYTWSCAKALHPQRDLGRGLKQCRGGQLLAS